MYLQKIKKKKKYKDTKSWLNNYLHSTKRKDVDLIIELIGGAEGPAKKLVFNALKNKKKIQSLQLTKFLIAKYVEINWLKLRKKMLI